MVECCEGVDRKAEEHKRGGKAMKGEEVDEV